MMEFLDAPLLSTAAFSETDSLLRSGEGPVRISGSAESQKVHIMMKAGGKRSRLLVTYDDEAALGIVSDARLFSDEVYFYPPKDFLFYQADARSNALAMERIRVYRALLEKENVTVVTTAEGLMNALLPVRRFREGILPLAVGDVIEVEALAGRLADLGYERVVTVEEPGQFTVHGGIVDLYDLTENRPFRLEFFDNEIDSIREFNPSSQVSVKKRERITVYPASELIWTEEEFREGEARLTAEYLHQADLLAKEGNLDAGAALQAHFRELKSALDRRDPNGLLEGYLAAFTGETSYLEEYFPEKPFIFVEEPLRVKDFAHLAETEFLESFRLRLEKGLVLPTSGHLIRTSEEVFRALGTGNTALFTALDSGIAFMRVKKSLRIEAEPLVSYFGSITAFTDDVKRYQKLGFSMVLLVESKTRAMRMAEELREYGLKTGFSDGRTGTELLPGTLLIAPGTLRKGYLTPLQKFVLFTENDLFSRREKKARKKKTIENAEKIRSYRELSAGDYVVHENYGIGIYRGIVKIKTDDVLRDYMQISYGTSGTLYVLVTHFDVVQKYASADAKPPKLSRLDSPEWAETRSRVRSAVKEVAEELVRLYYARQHETGYEFGPDTVWQREFEESFPFTETDDQLKAIAEVKEDMESTKIMDRLICGDVGFGKTEIALRAAFKAVQEGKQVAFLVPTTILAEQHYHTFRERMQKYPVAVSMLSRFTPAKEEKTIVEDLKRGMTDIVIGTHKILSEKVRFKDLGLLVIDEEQRFGVRDKERIKQMKTNVDVITLTATPIPRTLHMSMIGVRDMSLLTEPPEDRRAIQTYVMEYSEELAREAIVRELSRKGQVYYVYNRAADIQNVTARLEALVPEARISYVHGKMSEREIEKRMVDFIRGETDVLVSTTIIETGLDIPNANTIIIQDAERYGLAQLYQLRGRVGRSNRQAFAFIMYRRERIEAETPVTRLAAEKRLEAIRQFTELGSGLKIAMQDLEIRGAGAILGNIQSGHMAAVGYDLYCKMLSAAVEEAKGDEAGTADFDTLLDVKVSAYISDEYIPDEELKLETYKKIALLRSEAERGDLLEELVDRYGDPPKPVENLMDVALLRLEAHKLYFTKIRGDRKELVFTFAPFAKIRSERIPELLLKMKGAMRVKPGQEPELVWHEMNLQDIGKTPLLEVLKRLLAKIRETLEA